MKRTLAATAVILAALLLAGCTSQGSGDSGSTSGVEPGVVTGQPAPVKDASGGVTTINRDVITTGTVSISTKDPIAAARTATTITEQAGGRVDSRNETPATKNQPASATLVLRIPADDLDRTLAELKKLGTVNFLTLNAADVTQQTRDIDARITSLKTSVDRLLALMATAKDTTDLIALESALSSRQAELQSLQSQRDYLSDQIDYSTITLELFSEGTVAPPQPGTFWDGIVAGWNALIATIGGVLVGLGFILPWLAALGVVGAIVLLILWVSTRKRKAT
jgi:hypothetical protein